MVDLASLARGGDVQGLREHLMDHDLPRIVDELERLDAFPRAVAFRSLPKDLALATFENLDPPLQRELIDRLRDEGVGDLIAGLDPGDRVGLLDELPAGVAARLLSGLDPAELQMTNTLLGYPPESTVAG